MKKSDFHHGTLLATLDRLGLELPLDQLVDELGRTGRTLKVRSKIDEINEMNKYK